ncbi:MAG: hypothetical protein KatS3mg084_0186 [Candidatus Dojkabacteria bacterium]|nr:MAG: hypothetical protein KatS3mg084_0186 [Candidatus Dojkabacteria bacterium]
MNAQNMIARPATVQKVIKPKTKVPHLNILELLVSVIVVLTLFIFVGSFLAFSGWLYTYKALTAEQVIAELHISRKIIKDGVPTIRVRYVPFDENPALSFLPRQADVSTLELELPGDQVFIDANFIRWQNWVSLLNISPVYKVYRIRSDFNQLSDRQNFKAKAIDLNGGPDTFIEDFSKYSENFNWLVQSAFISSAGQNATDRDRVFYVVVTKDSIILEHKS